MRLPDIKTARWLVFDLETDLLDFKSPWWNDQSVDVIQVAWKLRGEPVKHHYGSLRDATEFWQDVEKAEVLVAHNVKFEAHWMLRHNFDPTDKFWIDTMILQKFIQGNRFRKGEFSLASVCEKYGETAKDPMIDNLMKSGVPTRDIDQERLMARCRRDVRTTEKVMIKQLKRLLRERRVKPALMRCQLTPILVHMERAGMTLDPERVRRTYAQFSAEHAEVKAEFDKLTGGINQNSPKQKAEYLYKVLKFPERRGPSGRPIRGKKTKDWPDGMPKTDKDTMDWLMTQATTEKQREYVRLARKLSKLDAALNKNLKFFRGVCEERNGQFTAEFNQCNTATDRLSSSGLPLFFQLFEDQYSVQFQNMPRIFKPLFTTDKDDYYIVETDAAQLEFRVAAFLGDDSQAKHDIQDPNFDAHCTSAAVMQQLEYTNFLHAYRNGDKEYKVMRQDAKADTFKPLYGGTKGTPEQERWYKEFNNRYNELHMTQESWLGDVLATGKNRTTWGQVFSYWYSFNKAGIPLDKLTGKPIGPAVFNHPVQALATAEIVPIALIHLYHACKKAGLRVIFMNTVHDSVIALVHKEDMDRFRKAAVWAFTKAVYKFLKREYGITFDVPLGVEIVHGTHWSEGEEYSVDVQPEVS